jgi:hypothetical protein
MTVQDGEEFVVLDVAQALPDMGFTQEAKVRHQLTEPYLLGQSADFSQYR